MVQYVEGLQPECRVEALVDGEDAGDLGVELVVGNAAEGVSADVSICSVSAQVAGESGAAPGSDLSEGGRVQVSPVCPAGSGTDGLVEIDRDSGNEVRAIVRCR